MTDLKTPPYGCQSGKRATIASVMTTNGSAGSGASQRVPGKRSSRGKVTSNRSNGASTCVIAAMSPGHGVRTVTCGGRSFGTPTVSTSPGNGTASANSAIGGFEADEPGADQAGRRPELRPHDLHLVTHRAQRLAAQDPLRRRNQVVPRSDAEAAADHDQRGLEDVGERAHRRAEVLADLGDDRARLLVALVREADETVCVGGRAERVLCRLRRREAGHVRLEMPTADAMALTGTAVVDDHGVTQFDAAAVGAPERAAVRDDAAAEAGAEREHDEVVDAAPGAGTPLRDRRGVRVVVEAGGKPEPLGHVIAERVVLERQVDHVERPPRAQI